MCLHLLSPPAHAALIQHLKITNGASVTTGAEGSVLSWADRSGAGKNAVPKVGTVVFPSSSFFSSGGSGVAFGPARSSLQLLNAADTDALLDFTSAASGNSGFAVMVSVRVDTLKTDDWNDLIGVTSNSANGGFAMRWSLGGVIQAFMGGTVFQRPTSDVEVKTGDSLVLIFNYNAATGEVQLWDSLNQTTATWTKAAGDFSIGGDSTFRLGELGNGARFFIGAVGEVQIYNSALTPQEFNITVGNATEDWVNPPGPPLFQHLDAASSGSVIGNPLTQWNDQSGSSRNAVPAFGTTTFPSAKLFTSGRPGVSFGADRNYLRLLPATTAEEVFDFNGAAGSHTGFSALLSVRVDELRSQEWNDLLVTTSVASSGGFGIRYSINGTIQAYMGGTIYFRQGGARTVSTGVSVVLALNYDASTGVVTLWDSLNASEVTFNVAAGDFAGGDLTLGGSDNVLRFINGSVGEVKLYSQKLSASEFASARDAMTLKWVGIPPAIPAVPQKPAWTISQLLAWSPATDSDAPFNVSTVPLQNRFTVPSALKANANSRGGQGGIMALDTHAGDRPQGGGGSIYTFTYWQYLEQSVYWGGIGAINFVPPTGEMIDNAHRNGVPILGTVFFPPTVYGGNYSWVQTFLQKVGNSYPAADKLIETAEYYGFDGWFINQETEGGNAADAAAMRDLIRYIRDNSNLTINWYDSMVETGQIAWQDQLNTANDWYLRHNYSNGLQDSAGSLIANSMFVDFSYDPSTTLPSNSRSRAVALGLDPYKIFTGLETQAEDFMTSTSARISMAKIFPDGQNHITSAGLYIPKQHATQIPEQDLFWTGASGDPRDTSTTVGTGNWRGVAHNIAERSVIDSLPFATDFNIGQGTNYCIEGTLVRAGQWWNRAVQAILPTWRWIVDSTGSKLTPELWTGDSFQGGSCLRVSGSLDAANTIRLYLTDLYLTSETKLKIVFKRHGLSNVDAFMDVGISVVGSPTTYTYYDAGNCVIDGWNQTVIDLGAQAGDRLRTIALRFDSPTPLANYEIRVGQIVVYNESQPFPLQASGIQELDVVGWNGLASGRVAWTPASGDRYTYDVYLKLADDTLVFVGSTPNNYYYFKDIPLPGEYASVVVQTVGPDMRRSLYSDETYPTPSISRINGTTVRLSWPAVTGARVQTRGDLTQPPDWQDIPGLTVQHDGETNYVDILIGSDVRRFFRLAW